MLIIMPIAMYIHRFEEPPALKNGSVIPMQGRIFRHIPMLIIA